MSTTIETGTISHGTLRPEDLIPAFLGAIKDLDEGIYREIIENWDAYFVERCCTPRAMDYPTSTDLNRREDLLEHLFDTLDGMASPGTYFGAIEGDGSDFGFWPIEDEDS